MAAFYWILRIFVLSAMWAGIFGTGMRLGEEKEIKKFDPFDILDVSPQAPTQLIKRAYEALFDIPPRQKS